MIVVLTQHRYDILNLLTSDALSVYEIAEELRRPVTSCSSQVWMMFNWTHWLKRAVCYRELNGTKSKYVYSTTQYGRNKIDRFVATPTRAKPYEGDLIGVMK